MEVPLAVDALARCGDGCTASLRMPLPSFCPLNCPPAGASPTHSARMPGAPPAGSSSTRAQPKIHHDLREGGLGGPVIEGQHKPVWVPGSGRQRCMGGLSEHGGLRRGRRKRQAPPGLASCGLRSGMTSNSRDRQVHAAAGYRTSSSVKPHTSEPILRQGLECSLSGCSSSYSCWSRVLANTSTNSFENNGWGVMADTSTHALEQSSVASS